MDTLGKEVIGFPGGLYAVVCGIDAESNVDEMAVTEVFIKKYGLDYCKEIGGYKMSANKLEFVQGLRVELPIRCVHGKADGVSWRRHISVYL